MAGEEEWTRKESTTVMTKGRGGIGCEVSTPLSTLSQMTNVSNRKSFGKLSY